MGRSWLGTVLAVAKQINAIGCLGIPNQASGTVDPGRRVKRKMPASLYSPASIPYNECSKPEVYAAHLCLYQNHSLEEIGRYSSEYWFDEKKKLRNVGGEEGPLEVSHLCGEDQCVNPEHICLERWRITNERKENCHGHGLSATCKHTPRCILQKGGNSRSTGYGKKKKNNDAN
jgi:hypothetical protein